MGYPTAPAPLPLLTHAIASRSEGQNASEVNFAIGTPCLTNWVTVQNLPTTADNSGNTVVNPMALSAVTHFRLDIDLPGREVLLRLAYATAGTVSAAVVVQPFGFDDAGTPMRLYDRYGNNELTMTKAATDATNGTLGYSEPVRVSLQGCRSVVVAIKTALVGSDLGTPVIQARLCDAPDTSGDIVIGPTPSGDTPSFIGNTTPGGFSAKVSFTAVGGAYIANDVIAASTAALLELANCARVAGGKLIITDAKVVVPTASITARIRVHLYETNTKTPTADNAPYSTTTASDSGSKTIDLPGLQLLASGITFSRASGLSITMNAVSTSIYAEIETLDGVTLDGTESFFLEVAGVYSS